MRELVIKELNERGWATEPSVNGRDLLARKVVVDFGGLVTSEFPVVGNTFISFDKSTNTLCFLVFESDFERFLEMLNLKKV